MRPPRSPAPDEFQANRSWSNWSGLASATPRYTAYPGSESEVAEVIRFAVAEGLPVRPVGSGHSWTALCATPGVLVDLRNLTGVQVIDRERRLVAVKAGTTVWELGEALWREGFSLENQGDIDVQTVAGAVSTGTHGSGAQLGIMASSVRGVRLVDGRGNVQEITDAQPARLKAAQVSLGLLGVITEVVLEVVDCYYLEEQVSYPTWAQLLESWDADVADHRHSSWFWFPHEDSPPLWQVAVPDGQPMADRAHLRRIQVTEGPARQIGERRRVDRNYLIYHGTAVNISGAKPWARALTEQLTVEHLPPTLIEEYAALSPDGREHFPVVFDKLARAIIDTPQTLDDLRGITAPTLVMAGDDDLVTVEHEEAMRAAVQDGQLAIVPGASHGLPLEKPDLVVRLILDFLADEQTLKFMPGPAT